MLAPPLMAGDDWGHDLVIRCGFLRNYVVTFDYPGGASCWKGGERETGGPLTTAARLALNIDPASGQREGMTMGKIKKLMRKAKATRTKSRSGKQGGG
jgi:hypothetical protein